MLWLASSLFFCLLGQHYLVNLPDYAWDAAIFYVVGLFSFSRVLSSLGAPLSPAPGPSEVDCPTDAPFEPVSRYWPLVVLAAGLAAVGYRYSAKNTFTDIGVLAWLCAVLYFLVAMWPQVRDGQLRPAIVSLSGIGRRSPKRSVGETGARGEGFTIHLKWRTVALLVIIALAAFFRLYRLEQVPPEMTSDHIEKLLDIHDLANGARPIYFERNTGREPFQFYWAFVVMRVFDTGITFYGLKLANALIGIITVYGIYLLGRELAGEDVGLLAAFFASVMQWVETITRIGLRFSYATLAATFALWMILRALRTGRRADCLVAGLIFGAGFYGYTAYRVMPVVLAALVAAKLLLERPRSRPAWWQFVFNLAVFSLIAIIVLVPLGRYWQDRPETFWYRSATRLEGEFGFTPQNVWLTLGNNALRALGMFNVVGDTAWANTWPDKPALDEVGGAFFLLGVLAVLYRLLGPKRALNQAEGVAGKPRDWPLWMAMVAGFILLFPSILSVAFPHENPSVVRTAGAIPVVAVLVGAGLYVVTQAAQKLGGRWLAASLLALMLAATTVINYRHYFVDYDRSYQLLSQNSSEMAEAMRGFIATGGDLQHITIRAWPYWVDTRALALLMGDPTWQDTNVVIEQVNDLSRQRDDPAPQMYLLNVNDLDGLAVLQETFPQGYLVWRHSQIPGHDFMLFLVPAR